MSSPQHPTNPSQAALAVRCWVALVLAREHRRTAATDLRDAADALRVQLAGMPPERVLREISRQRLVPMLATDLEWLDATPGLADLGERLRSHAHRQIQAALALSHLTGQVSALFAHAGQPLLVFKGIPLALQTTGSLTARGRGDLDLLVPPDQLPAAVRLLEGSGFVRLNGEFPKNLQSFWGRFCRWTAYELSLQHSGPGGVQIVDLHWSLSHTRSPLPAFDLLWSRRESVKIGKEVVNTLCRRDAVFHAAVHAAKDRWSCLRHCVDLDRLARQLTPEECRVLRRQPLVRLSAGVAHALTAGQELAALTDPTRADVRHAVAIAMVSQSQPLRTRREQGPWSLPFWVVMVAQKAGMSPQPLDWLRTLLYYVVMPGAFNDPVTGEDRGLRAMLRARRARLSQKLSRSAPASVGSAPEP